MPILKKRTKVTSAAVADDAPADVAVAPPAVAHIVQPASKLADAKRGESVQGLCGATVTGDPTPGAGVCRDCFVKQLEADDKRLDAERAAAEERARERGKAEGRRTLNAELDTLLREKAAADRAEAEAPRYEDIGKALKLKLVDGGEATVRKKRVASVQLVQNGSNHAVIVDGNVVHVGPDAALARKHHADVHQAVFGE